MNFYKNNYIINMDAPSPWGIYFQDSASPQFEGLIELHDWIMYYLVIILFTVGWILLSIVSNYVSEKTAFSHKYMNHGIISVPIRKCSKLKISGLGVISVRTYSSQSSVNNPPAKYYEDAYNLKKLILNENKGESGIYMWTNKITGDIYIGQSSNLSLRFRNYFNISYLKSKENYIISRALIKYGYSNFSLTILEICNKSKLLEREQYYLDNLGPKYNILKIAGSSSGYTLLEETKAKISKSLKGVYIGEKSYWFGKIMSEETKNLMSSKKMGELNNFYGKTHSEETKELMSKKALGRKHSEYTKLKMSTKRGNPLNVYEKCDSDGFKLIGSFVSARKAGKFLNMSGSTINKYLNSGAIFKDRYKFSSK